MTTYSVISGGGATNPPTGATVPNVLSRVALCPTGQRLLLYVSSGGAYGVCLPGQLPAGAVGLRVIQG